MKGRIEGFALRTPAVFEGAQKEEIEGMQNMAVMLMSAKGEVYDQMRAKIAQRTREIEARYGAKADTFQTYQALIGGTPLSVGEYDTPDKTYSVSALYAELKAMMPAGIREVA